jgi:alpha-galactosidase
MVHNEQAQDAWADVDFVAQPFPTISYRTGLTVYEESCIRGRFVGRGWNGAGYMNPDELRLAPEQHPMPQAFNVEIEGQLLASGWEWVGFEQCQEEKGLHAIVRLRHTRRPVSLAVHTLLDGTPVIMRWLEIQNLADHPVALAECSVWSGVLHRTRRWQSYLPSKNAPLWSAGYFEDTHWGDEGNFRWHVLPNAGYRVDGRYRRERYRHPMFVLRNHATGEHFIGQLAWSGGYAFEFDLDADVGTGDLSARLFLRAGPDAPAPQRVIAAGETIRTPEMHLGVLQADFDTTIQAMHEHLRRTVFPPQPPELAGLVLSGIGPEQEINYESVYHEIETGAALGAEVFFIDAGWYTPVTPGGTSIPEWYATAGDWNVNLQRFPQGLEPIRQAAHEHGMRFGLWIDAERIGAQSKIAAEHPEWVAVAYDGQKRLGDLLDLTNPAAAAWMESEIARVFTENQCEFYKLDHNTPVTDHAQTERDGFTENISWRYYQTLYASYDRLRARFPHVHFQNCAGGGGRTDIGLMSRFMDTLMSDWHTAPRSFSIFNGMSMALPPEYLNALLGQGVRGHQAAELDFQARILLFGQPLVAFLNLVPSQWNPVQVARVRHMVDLYKSFVRPYLRRGRIYHHTPVFDGPEAQGWGVLELASQDRRRAMAGVFQLSSPQEAEYTLRLRGLDAGLRYRVTFDNENHTAEVDGFTLMKQGLVVRVEAPLTSELLLFEAI